MKTYFLQVKEVIRETADSVTIEFWHPLSEQIKYKAGQFVTVIVPHEGKKIRRSYSMSTSPQADTSLGITIKRVKDGIVSNYLNDNVKKGDFLEIIEPMGNFYITPDAANQRHIVLFAAGSGVTPIMSMAKSILKIEPNSRVSLLYGNRNEESIIFKAEIEALEEKYQNRFRCTHILSRGSDTWVGDKGHINEGSSLRWMKDVDTNFAKDEFYMCGPIGMMDSVIKSLAIFDVDKARVHKENFHSATDEDTSDENAGEILQNQIVKVKYDGEVHEFEVKPHQTILEAALDLDIDLPYSCQAGMCTACMGKCKEGKVAMDEEDGLTEKEVAQGFVLTCVAHPMSAGVVIEID